MRHFCTKSVQRIVQPCRWDDRNSELTEREEVCSDRAARFIAAVGNVKPCTAGQRRHKWTFTGLTILWVFCRLDFKIKQPFLTLGDRPFVICKLNATGRRQLKKTRTRSPDLVSGGRNRTFGPSGREAPRSPACRATPNSPLLNPSLPPPALRSDRLSPRPPARHDPSHSGPHKRSRTHRWPGRSHPICRGSR